MYHVKTKRNESANELLGGFIETFIPIEGGVVLLCREGHKEQDLPFSCVIRDPDGTIYDYVCGLYDTQDIPNCSFPDLSEAIMERYCERLQHLDSPSILWDGYDLEDPIQYVQYLSHFDIQDILRYWNPKRSHVNTAHEQCIKYRNSRNWDEALTLRFGSKLLILRGMFEVSQVIDVLRCTFNHLQKSSREIWTGSDREITASMLNKLFDTDFSGQVVPICNDSETDEPYYYIPFDPLFLLFSHTEILEIWDGSRIAHCK